MRLAAVSSLLLVLCACELPGFPVAPDGGADSGVQPVAARFIAGGSDAGVQLVEISHDGVDVVLDVRTSSSERTYGLAYALQFDAACLRFEKFEAPAAVEAPVRAAQLVAPGDVRGVATFRSAVDGVAAGTHAWGRLHFRALAKGSCALSFVDDRSRVLRSRSEAAEVTWSGGAVEAE